MKKHGKWVCTIKYVILANINLKTDQWYLKKILCYYQFDTGIVCKPRLNDTKMSKCMHNSYLIWDVTLLTELHFAHN